MRLRRLDGDGDMIFGSGQADYWHNVPEGIAQWCFQRLRLNTGEWFVDVNEGTPWAAEVLGERTRATRDLVVRDRVASTPGVTAILAYGSRLDPNTRTWVAAMRVDTVFGTTVLGVPRLPTALPPLVPPGGAVEPAYLLGVRGAHSTPVTMQPADLRTPPPDVANVTGFRIMSVDGAGNP